MIVEVAHPMDVKLTLTTLQCIDMVKEEDCHGTDCIPYDFFQWLIRFLCVAQGH